MIDSTLCEAQQPQQPRTEPVSIGLGGDPQIPDDLHLPHPRHGWYLPMKRAIEWAGALVLLILTAPLLLALAAMVRATSHGPALYAQLRLGRSGRLYRMYKLRTMCHDAEAHTGPVWAAKDDVRITPIGRFLRDTHLDELPQLWNVLRGEMALIGPRPERPEIAARIAVRVPTFHHRLMMRPGVTGLAQMLCPADDPNDSNYEGLRRKLAHDLAYLRRVNPILDLKIIASTSCYFFAAAVDAIRRLLLKSYAPSGELPAALGEIPAVGLEQGAA